MFEGSSVNKATIFKQKFKVVVEVAVSEGLVMHPPSNNKRLRDIRHSMSSVLDQRKSVFGSQQRLQFHI